VNIRQQHPSRLVHYPDPTCTIWSAHCYRCCRQYDHQSGGFGHGRRNSGSTRTTSAYRSVSPTLPSL